jgi:SNF2 family DNA or RNA helicase
MLEATAEIDPTKPGRITVLSDFRCKDAIKACPGARWDTTSRHWTLPLTWPSCLALRAEFGTGLAIGDDLRKWAKAKAISKARLTTLHTLLEPPADTEYPGCEALPGFADLYPFQKVDAEAIAEAGSYLLMNETGSGKSRSALGGLSLLQHSDCQVFPLGIVAPKSMLITWSREVARFFPDAEVRIVAGTPTKIRKALDPGADVYIMGWDTIRKYSRLASYASIALTAEEKKDKEIQALGLTSTIFDECHRAQNPKAQRTRAAWAVADGCAFRIGLTGSPMQDTPEDLYGVLHLLFPDEYPTKTAYVERYLEVDWNEWGGREVKGLHPTRAPEFLANLDTISRRLTKEIVLPFLPEKLFEVRWVTLPPKLRKAYDGMRDTLIAEMESGTVAASNNLERSGRLTQLANAPGTINADRKYIMESPSPKVEAFMDDVLSGDFDGQQVVAFADSKELIKVLAEEMTKKKVPFVKIDGSVTGDDRQKAMDAFQAGEVQFCLLTRAGGEGITLTAASVMARLMRSWSYTVHTQVEDRVHRIGSEVHDNVLYIDYVTEDTIEMAQIVRLNGKAERAQEVLRDDEMLKLMKGKVSIDEVMASYKKEAT